MTLSLRMLLAGAVLVAVGAAIVGGFLVVGSPTEARFRRLDERRVSDLHQAVTAVNVYWTRKHELPSSLEAALKESAMTTPLADPVTAQPYEYRVATDVAGPSAARTSERDQDERGPAFELCATFDRKSARENGSAPGDPFWSHAAGRQCFTIPARDLSKAPGR